MAAAAAACMALAGCDQLGIGGKAESNASANVGAPAMSNASGGKPAAGDTDRAAADPGAGLGGKDSNGAIQAGSGIAGGAVTVDRAYMLGRWTDDGDCENAVDFGTDGRFLTADGVNGVWNLAGDRLTMTAERTLTVQIVPIDQNSMTVVNADGSLGRSTRC